MFTFELYSFFYPKVKHFQISKIQRARLDKNRKQIILSFPFNQIRKLSLGSYMTYTEINK